VRRASLSYWEKEPTAHLWKKKGRSQHTCLLKYMKDENGLRKRGIRGRGDRSCPKKRKSALVREKGDSMIAGLFRISRFFSGKERGGHARKRIRNERKLGGLLRGDVGITPNVPIGGQVLRGQVGGGGWIHGEPV